MGNDDNIDNFFNKGAVPSSVLDYETEQHILEEAMKDHVKVAKIIQNKKKQLEHTLKFWL